MKKALEELHDLGYAHLDVRLDNVCLKVTSSGMMAVLIDFDFVMKRDQPLKKPHLVEKSTMYNIPEYQHFADCQPAWKFDWWQLGLMAAYCLTVHGSKERPEYHTF